MNTTKTIGTLSSFAEYTNLLNNDLIKTRTKSYFEPITGNVLHRYRPGRNLDDKTYLNDITDLNKNLTIEVKVSYDGGETYEQTGTLPLKFYTREVGDFQPKIWSFNQDWTKMDQHTQLNLEKGGKSFSHNTLMGYFARNLFITYDNLDNSKYEVVNWIMNNTTLNGDIKQIYQPRDFEEKNPVITLLIKKIENWICTVTFNTEALNNNDIQINQLEVEPNTKIAAPIISPELHPVGHICKWYTKEGVEFDFDTHITQDYELYGRWVREAEEGDYRLLYVEQVVEKSTQKEGDEWKTIITRKKAHPSDIIRQGTLIDTVSLHTYKDRKYAAKLGDGLDDYESSNNPEIILQKYLGNDQWQDVECQMVYGPLETLPVMGQLPGRKNASSNSTIDDLRLHNGIENIKNDTHEDQGNGVWNFVVTQDAGKASVQWDQTHRYEGKYYIRTDVANGGWNNYTASDNYMTFSSYSKNHRDFSHYFCRWI